MNADVNSLPNDIDLLKQLLAEKESVIAQQKQFGKSSEGFAGQGELFNEVEDIADTVVEAETQDISTTRKKVKRKPLPKELPRETIVHELSDEEKSVRVVRVSYIKLVKIKRKSLSSFPLK